MIKLIKKWANIKLLLDAVAKKKHVAVAGYELKIPSPNIGTEIFFAKPLDPAIAFQVKKRVSLRGVKYHMGMGQNPGT